MRYILSKALEEIQILLHIHVFISPQLWVCRQFLRSNNSTIVGGNTNNKLLNRWQLNASQDITYKKETALITQNWEFQEHYYVRHDWVGHTNDTAPSVQKLFSFHHNETLPLEPEPIHCRGFMITLTHTTLLWKSDQTDADISTWQHKTLRRYW